MLVKLLILWLLAEQPHHGYRIKRILDEDSLRFWFPVEVGSIYAVLGTLTKQGLIVQEAVEREGNRPERTRYRITKEGREHMQELLRSAWSDLPRMADPINAALAAMPELEEAEIVDLLGKRREALEERLRRLDTLARSAPAPEMAGRLRALTEAELKWTEGTIESMKEEAKR